MSRDFPAVDWPTVLDSLMRSGWTLQAIGDALGKSRSSVRDWHLGTTRDLRHTDGEALLELARRAGVLESAAPGTVERAHPADRTETHEQRQAASNADPERRRSRAAQH